MLRPTLFRPTPKMPAAYYRTFQVTSPTATHTRPATCQEVDCTFYLRGWTTTLDVSTPEGRTAAEFIRVKSGRAFTHTQTGDVVVFTFPAGQTCLGQHKLPVGRPEIYVVRGGDHRGNPRGETRRHTRPEHFVEQFAEHLDKLNYARNQG